VNPHAVEEATRPLQQELRDAQTRQREVARETARAQAALQAALSRREALEIRVSSGRGGTPQHHHADNRCKCLQSFAASALDIS
jgi:hypothetical protein